MSAVGIDFGNETCYIAVARAGGIETVANDYSQRATPSYVAFTPTCRDLGTSAKNKSITNLRNTVSSFKRLLGKKFKDGVLQHELSYLPYQVKELPNGSVGVNVSYLGNDSIFTVQQIASMLLTKLKIITEVAFQSTVTDCVISVPVFFTDAERRAMMDVCQVANLNVLRLLNETTAVALAYGFYRQDLSESKPKKVAFIDIGHTALQASVCEFYQGKLKVLCSNWDMCLGGRDLDNSIVRHFIEDFKTKYHLNVSSSPRAIVRLLQECEKLKKQLSANPQELPMNIECLMDDVDVHSRLGREKFEELCGDIFIRIEDVLKRLLSDANLSPGDIGSVELVGGTTRTPAIRNIIKRVFGMEPSTTLNLDEAVARGCALQAAMLSPNVKVKEFHMTDIQPMPIKLFWNISKTERGDIEAFSRYHPVPFSKLLTFFRKEDFTLDAYYALDVVKFETFIGSFTIKNINQMPSGESVKIIIKLRININGIFTICSAVIADKETKDNALDQKTEDLADIKSDAGMAVDPVVNEEKKPFFSLKKHKKVPQEIELQIEAKVPQLSESELKTFFETEQKMIQQDICQELRINAKNSLEEFVYELRNRLSEELRDYVDDQEHDDLLQRLTLTEEWIYNEGEDQNEAAYKDKLAELKSFAQPPYVRKFQREQREVTICEFQNIIFEARRILGLYLAGNPHYEHMEAKDMEQVQRAVDEKDNWLRQQITALKELKAHQNSPVSVQSFVTELQKLKDEIFPILNKPKPPQEVLPPPQEVLPPEDKTSEKSESDINC